jgi:TATA-box binding protein (TBP) (component of TFIID and TFIIIB)
VSLKRKAYDPDQASVIKEILADPVFRDGRFVVTGAWAYTDGTGYVYSVQEAIDSIGFRAEGSEFALSDC